MPQPKPTPKDPKYAEALAALRRLASSPASSDAATAADGAVLELAEADWRLCVNTWSRFGRCPTCHRFGLSVLWGDEHVVACREHPAVKRARRAESEWLAVSAVARALGNGALSPAIPPRSEWPAPTLHGHRRPDGSGRPFVQVAYERETREALTAVCQSVGRDQGQDLSKHVRVLEEMLFEWGHYLDRARHPVPCPCCHELLEVRALPAHVAGCRGHPDWRRAEVLEAAVASLTGGAETGVGALVDDLDRTRLVSCDLLAACWSVIDAFGFQEHGRSYLRHSDQERFEAAVRVADEVLASVDPDRAEP